MGKPPGYGPIAFVDITCTDRSRAQRLESFWVEQETSDPGTDRTYNIVRSNVR